MARWALAAAAAVLVLSPIVALAYAQRAALAWTEAVTRVTEGHVPDEVYAVARAQFSEKEICDLTLAVAAINAWNRLVISSRTVPGGYQAGSAKAGR